MKKIAMDAVGEKEIMVNVKSEGYNKLISVLKIK